MTYFIQPPTVCVQSSQYKTLFIYKGPSHSWTCHSCDSEIWKLLNYYTYFNSTSNWKFQERKIWLKNKLHQKQLKTNSSSSTFPYYQTLWMLWDLYLCLTGTCSGCSCMNSNKADLNLLKSSLQCIMWRKQWLNVQTDDQLFLLFWPGRKSLVLPTFRQVSSCFIHISCRCLSVCAVCLYSSKQLMYWLYRR